MCEREPGLFRKGDLLLSVYVDDSLMSGADKALVEKEMNLILSKHAGKIIAPEYEDIDGKKCEVRDILGATLYYSGEERYMKLSMNKAIDRVLKKFNMVGCTPKKNP